MTEKRYIYALIDPRTKKEFYIGQSKNPDVRLLNHLHKSYLLKTPKDVLLSELIKLGKVPKVKILEEIEVDTTKKLTLFNLSDRENYWINRILGGELLNIQKNINGKANERCLYCEKDFYKKHKKGKFCSPKCRVYWNREHATKTKEKKEATPNPTKPEMLPKQVYQEEKTKNSPKTYDQLLKMAKEGVDNMDEFMQELKNSKVTPGQKAMILSKIK